MGEDASYLKNVQGIPRYSGLLVIEDHRFLHNRLQVCKHCKTPMTKAKGEQLIDTKGGFWWIPHRPFPSGNLIHTDAVWYSNNTIQTLGKLKSIWDCGLNSSHMLSPGNVSLLKSPQHMDIYIFPNAREICHLYLSPHVCKLNFKIMNESMREQIWKLGQILI